MGYQNWVPTIMVLPQKHFIFFTVKCNERKGRAWFRRGIAACDEAIWIAKENPSLNRDRGRHTLPPVYNQLLSSRDTHTTQGRVTTRKLQTTEEGLKYRVESSRLSLEHW